MISFDESLNKSTQNCQMDTGICFWSQEAKQVQVRYWDSLVELDVSKIIQIAMGGPNVNWCFYDEVVKNRGDRAASAYKY